MPSNSSLVTEEEDVIAPQPRYVSELFTLRNAYRFEKVAENEFAKLDTELQIIRAEGLNYCDINLAYWHAKYIDISIRRIIWTLYHEEYNESLHSKVTSIINNLRTLLFDLELFLYSAPFLRRVHRKLICDNPKYHDLSDTEQRFVARVRNVSWDKRGYLNSISFNELNKREQDYICRLHAYNIVHPSIDVMPVDFTEVNYLSFGPKLLSTKLVAMHSVLDYLCGNISPYSLENINKVIIANNEGYAAYDLSFAHYELALLKLALLVGVLCNLQKSNLGDRQVYKERIHSLGRLVYGKLNLKFAIIHSATSETFTAEEIAEYMQLSHTLLAQAVEHLLDAKPESNLVVKKVLLLLDNFPETKSNQRFQEYMVLQDAADLESSGSLVVFETKKISTARSDSPIKLPSMVELPVPVSEATLHGNEQLMFSHDPRDIHRGQGSVPGKNCCLPINKTFGCSIC